VREKEARDRDKRIMAVPSPNILLALFIVSFSLSAIFHRSSTRHSNPSNPAQPPSIFSHYAADILVPSTNDTFSSRPAAFGGPFDDILQAELVKAWGDDGLACQLPISDTSSELSPTDIYQGKIVLVRRGKCSFAEKVRNIQKVGGIAVIVGDNTAGSGLLTMYAKGIIMLGFTVNHR
jgi:PA domain